MNTLYKMYSPPLYGVISAIVKEPQLAEEVLIETFAKVWKYADGYDSDKGRLFTWMINIARHSTIDIIRSKSYKNCKKHVLIDDYQIATDRHHWVSYNPETIMLKELLYHLEPKFNILLQMAYFEGYTQTEIADRLHMPLGTVKTRIRTALIELRHKFN